MLSKAGKSTSFKIQMNQLSVVFFSSSIGSNNFCSSIQVFNIKIESNFECFLKTEKATKLEANLQCFLPPAPPQLLMTLKILLHNIL